jgi:hypothetical protein
MAVTVVGQQIVGPAVFDVDRGVERQAFTVRQDIDPVKHAGGRCHENRVEIQCRHRFGRESERPRGNHDIADIAGGRVDGGVGQPPVGQDAVYRNSS